MLAPTWFIFQTWAVRGYRQIMLNQMLSLSIFNYTCRHRVECENGEKNEIRSTYELQNRDNSDIKQTKRVRNCFVTC